MFRLINKCRKGNVIKTARVFALVYHVFFLKGILEQDFSDIYLITFFGDGNFGNTSAMGVIFFWKSSKFNVDFRNEEKNWEKVFSLLDNSIWMACVELPLLRREYLSSAVNVLTNSFKMVHSTNIDFFQLNYVQSHQ